MELALHAVAQRRQSGPSPGSRCRRWCAGEVRLLIVLVALGFADGKGHGQVEAAEELLEIDGVLSGGIDADVEVSLGILFTQLLQTSLQGLITVTVLQHGEGLGSLLTIGPEERDTMTITARYRYRRRCGGGIEWPTRDTPGKTRRRATRRGNACRRGRRESPPEILGKVMLVISGPGRKMYQSLQPKPEGAFLHKRSMPHGTQSSPHDTGTSFANWLETNIQARTTWVLKMAALGKDGRFGSLGLSTLLRFHRLAEAVALAIHLENLRVVGQAVQQRRGHPLALEDLPPLAERKVARHQDAAAS